MKISTRILCLLAMPFAASCFVHAAEPPAGAPSAQHPRMQEMRERRLKKLDEKLSLTADQKAKINAIWDKAEGDARAARHDAASTAKDEMRTKRREGLKAVRQEVRAVLTPEQQKTFDTMPEDRPGRGGDAPEAK
ncbi:MAG: Spy/CpxP family protein refolding chaperone [Opitutus sp.]